MSDRTNIETKIKSKNEDQVDDKNKKYKYKVNMNIDTFKISLLSENIQKDEYEKSVIIKSDKELQLKNIDIVSFLKDLSRELNKIDEKNDEFKYEKQLIKFGKNCQLNKDLLVLKIENTLEKIDSFEIENNKTKGEISNLEKEIKTIEHNIQELRYKNEQNKKDMASKEKEKASEISYLKEYGYNVSYNRSFDEKEYHTIENIQMELEILNENLQQLKDKDDEKELALKTKNNKEKDLNKEIEHKKLENDKSEASKESLEKEIERKYDDIFNICKDVKDENQKIDQISPINTHIKEMLSTRTEYQKLLEKIAKDTNTLNVTKQKHEEITREINEIISERNKIISEKKEESSKIEEQNQKFDTEIKRICTIYKDYETDYLINHQLEIDEKGCYICNKSSIKKTVEYITTLKKLNRIAINIKDIENKQKKNEDDLNEKQKQLEDKNSDLSKLTEKQKQSEDKLKNEKNIEETVNILK